MIGFAFIHILKKNSSKCSWSHKHSAYRCCIPALTGLGGVHSQVSAAERRGGDSNPRWLLTIHDFQSCTFDHSDTSPDAYGFGERGIRTLGNAKHYTGFRVRLLRPLGHLSNRTRLRGFEPPTLSSAN